MRLWFLTNQLLNRFILTFCNILSFFLIYFYSSNIKIAYNRQADDNRLVLVPAHHLLFIIPTKRICTKKSPQKPLQFRTGQPICQKHQPANERNALQRQQQASHRLSALPSTVCQPADRQTGLSAELRGHREFQLPKFSLTPQWKQISLCQLIIFPS